MDKKAVARITLNHRATTQGLAGILPADTLEDLHQHHFDAAPLAWVELVATTLNTHPCDRIHRQATELWMVHRLADAQVQERILPALASVSAFQLCADDAERLALWRSLYQPLVNHHRHALTQPLPEPTLPSQKLDAGALRTVLARHYGNRVISLLEQAQRLHMVDTAGDLPEAMRARYSSLIESVAGATFGDGTVYLVADKIAPSKAAAIFLHEVGEHAGMAEMLGKDYGRLIQQFRRLLAKGDAYATWAAMRVPRSTPAAHVPSEQLAYLVEKVATDQQPDPAGQDGHALGKECLSHLRGWLFRTPLMSWLDSIGEADHFTLSAEDIAALARQAVDAQAQTLSNAPLDKSAATAWIDELDPSKLDTLFRCNARQRKMALADSSPEALAGYLYALQIAGARDLDATLDDHTPVLARMATGAYGDHLTVIAGELLEYAASRVPINAYRQQMSEGGLSMFRSTSRDGTSTLKVITGDADDALLTVRHFRQGQGYVMHELLDSATVEATLTAWEQPVAREDFGSALSEHAQMDTAHADGRLAQWRQQAQILAQPMFATGIDGLAFVRAGDLSRLPPAIHAQLDDKPASITLDNPVIDKPANQFITGAELARALGPARATEILMCEEAAVYAAPSWPHIAQASGATTLAELIQANRDLLAECELPAALAFGNPSYRAWFAEAGFDGAVYAASATGSCAISHVFDAAQISPYSRFGAVNTNDGMEGIAERFDAYQRAYWDYQTEEAKDLTGTGSAEAVWSASTKMADARDALAETMGNSSFLCLEGRTRDSDQIFLTPSAKHAGRWQITRMAGDGLPLSDTEYSSKEDACSELLQSITPNSLRLHAETGAVLRADGRATPPPDVSHIDDEAPRNTFAGEASAGADLEKLGRAKEMANKRVSASTIFKDTGWFQGVDGRWRYEISDDKAAFRNVEVDRNALAAEVAQDLVYRVEDNGLVKAVFNEGGRNHRAGFGYTEEAAFENLVHHVANMRETPFQYATVRSGDQFALEDVLDHKELFAAYPFLRNMIVEFRTDTGDLLGAHYERANMVVINASRREEEALSTLLHEVQHAIQGRENFARGGNANAEFTHNIQLMLQSLAEESAQEVEIWKASNQGLISAEAQAAEVAKAALLYQSMKNLMRYANREAPSGVFRLIRNELGWFYDPIIQGDTERRAVVRELDFKLMDTPRRGPKRNAAIREVAYEAAQLYRSCIPHDLLVKFSADERTLKGMVNAMSRAAQKARAAVEPLRQLKSNAVAAENLFKQSNFSGSFQIYRALAGEVEARLTQKRQSMTTEQRAGRFPLLDTDVPASEAIVYYRGVKVHLPSVTASMSIAEPVTDPAPGARRYVPEYHLQGWMQATGLPEETLEQYGRLGELQRGAPEQRMVQAQMVLGGSPLDPVIEHIGDLTNRMSPKHSIGFAFEETKDKIERQLRSLKSRYGFRRDYEESLGRTANYYGISRDEHTAKVNAALDAYADAHAQLETFTPIQTLARDAAVALGRRQFEQATIILEELHARMDSLPAFIRELVGEAGATTTVDQAAEQTDAPAFKHWFGNSKVIDAEGKPRVVFHGTVVRPDTERVKGMGDIAAFDRLFTTQFRAPSVDTLGSWFSSNPQEGGAQMYSGMREGAAIYPVYLAIQNPHETTFQLLSRRARLLANGEDDGRRLGEAEVNAYRKWLKDMGKDGIKIVHDEYAENGSTEFQNQEAWVALEPSQIKSAIGNVGTFDPGNNDIRFTFAGMSSVSHDVGTLAMAQDRLAAGDAPEVVRQETGWMKGVDGKWRYEINDANATLKPELEWDSRQYAASDELSLARDKVQRSRDELHDIVRFYGDSPENVSARTASTPEYISAQERVQAARQAVVSAQARFNRQQQRGLRVSDILDHPALFAAYPSLGDIAVAIQATERGQGATYYPRQDTIVIDESSREHLLPALIHELQHAIQLREGFAFGGTESQFTDRDVTDKRLAEVDAQIERLLASNPAFAEVTAARQDEFNRLKLQYGKGEGADRRLSLYEVPATERDSYLALLTQAQQFNEHIALRDLETLRRVVARDGERLAAHQQYRSLAGEVEARNVEARLAMSDTERQQVSPATTQDVPDSEVIVLFNGEAMDSAPLPQNATPAKSADQQVDLTSDEVKRWFRGSVMTDEEGKPLCLYHGTDAQFSEFEPSRTGLFGSGIYLSSSREDAEQYSYSGNVLEVIVNAAYPYYTTADYDAGEEFDIDSPAIPFIRELFGDEADALIEQAANNPDFSGFGTEVLEELESLGHDSIVVQWPYGGPTHVIPLYPSQVMIISGPGAVADAVTAPDELPETAAIKVELDADSWDARFALSASTEGTVFDLSLPEEGNQIRTYKHGETTISLSANGNTGEIEVVSVRTPRRKRRQGHARAAMLALIRQADAEDVPLVLGASPLDQHTRLDKLVEFYKSLGFSTTGKTLNLLGDPVMGRSPRRPAMEASHDGAPLQQALAGTKVADADGKPLVMYHGTRPGNDIQEFRVPANDGVYFTPDVLYAEGFTNELSGEDDAAGAIYPVYLNIQNPFIIHAEDGSPEWENFVYRGLDRAELESQGYDGAMLFINGHGLDQVIAFSNSQIMSAIGLAGATGDQTDDPDASGFRFHLANSSLDAATVGFGIRVSDLTLPTHELEGRNSYSRSNSLVPGVAEDLPMGSIRIAQYGANLEDRYVDVLAEVPVARLLLAEPEDNIRSHPTYRQYLEWAREGREAPLIQVNQNERGELVSVNRRRALAAKEAGLATIRAWVSPINPATGEPLKYRDVHAMAPGLAPAPAASAVMPAQPPHTPVQSAATNDLAADAIDLLQAIRKAYSEGWFDQVDELSEKVESLFQQLNPHKGAHPALSDAANVGTANEYLARAYAASLLHPGAGPDMDLLREAVYDVAESFGGMNEGVTDDHILHAARQAYDEFTLSSASTRPKFSPEVESILSGLPPVPGPAVPGIRVADALFHSATAPMFDRFTEWSKGTHVVSQSGAPMVVFSVDPVVSHADEANATFMAGSGSKRFMDFDTAWQEAERSLFIRDDGVAQPFQITPAYLALVNPVPGMNGRSATASFGHLSAALGEDRALALLEVSGQRAPVMQTANGAPYFMSDSQVMVAPILDNPECVKILISAGYDGAAYALNNADGSVRTEYRVFSPDQVLAGSPMAVITTDNAGSGLRFSTSASVENLSPAPTPNAADVIVNVQHSAPEIPLSLQLHHLGGLRVTGKPEAIGQHLLTEVQRTLGTTAEAIHELEGRLEWLGRSHQGSRHYEKTLDRLDELRRQHRDLSRWSAPNKHNHMQWDAPLGKGMLNALNGVIAIKPGAQVTGKMAVFLAASTYGDIQKGISKLAGAGIKGVEHGGDIVSWDKASLVLGEHHSLKAEGERFHIAYHGSPHVFDQFDREKMGSGEGAQAYGRGMYVTDTLKIASHYRSLAINHAVYFEETLYPRVDDLIADVVPEVCAQHPELREQPTALHQRLGITPTGHQLEAPLTHYLRMLVVNPYHAEDILSRHSPGIASILKTVGRGVMKYHEQDRDLMVFPRGGVRGLNEIYEADDNTYRLALTELEIRLHWFVDARADDDSIREQFQAYLAKSADTEAHRKAIEYIEAKLEVEPDSDFHMSQLRDAQWQLIQAENVAKLKRDYGELAIHRTAPRGNIYMVEIDVVESQYLHFDKPFREQPEAVVTILNEMVSDVLDEPFRSATARLIRENALAVDVYEAMHKHPDHKEAENCEAAARREDALARQLDSMGIHGIKYMDGFTRADHEKGTYNYVVFDTARMKILGRTTSTDPTTDDFLQKGPVEEVVDEAVQAAPALRMG